MTTKEKRLLKFALLIFIVFVSFQGLPTANKLVFDYWQHIQNLQQEIDNSKKLKDKTQFWEDENKRAKQVLSEVNSGLLEGENEQLVGANMQKLLREIARQTGLTVTTMDPPKTEISRANQWMLVIQTIQFDTDAKGLMTFLKVLDKAPKKLIVAMLDVRTNRDRLNGTVQITGFSHVPSPPPVTTTNP